MEKRSKKNYLITGGAGFIGANFLKFLLRCDPNVRGDVVVLDKLTYAGNLSSIAKELDREDVHFVRGDVSDVVLLEEIFRNYDIDIVVNFAAESHVDKSIENASVFLRTNVLGTQCLLDASMRSWKKGLSATGYPEYYDGKKFIQISTDEVYGFLPIDYPQAVSTELVFENAQGDAVHRKIKTFGKDSFDERTPLNPSSPYAASKASADIMALSYAKTYKFPLNITRCSNNYGPYQHPEKLIPLTVTHLIRGEKIPVYGDGKQVRDWIYVDDHCRAIFSVIQEGKIGEIYNVGGLGELQNIEVVRRIFEQYAALSFLGRSTSFEGYVSYVRDRLAHDLRYAVDIRKISSLGFQPSITFDVGIKETVSWYIEHTSWSESLKNKEINDNR